MRKGYLRVAFRAKALVVLEFQVTYNHLHKGAQLGLSVCDKIGIFSMHNFQVT